jgi:hypothetical protein
MKQTLTICLLLLAFTSLFSQTKKDVAGLWQFKEIIATKDMDEKSIAMLTQYFKETSFDFNENGLYLGTLMGNADNGKWILAGKKIELTSDKGEIYTLDIIEHKKDLLSVKLKKASFIMSRVSDSEIISPVSVTSDSYVAATKQQLCKKWFLKETISEKELTPEMKEALNSMFKGSYIRFNTDGSFDLEIMGIEEQGKWKFGDDKKAIITEAEGNKGYWNVLEISADKLVMVRGNNPDKYIFSSKE